MAPPDHEHFDGFSWRGDHCFVESTVDKSHWEIVEPPPHNLFQWGDDARERVTPRRRANRVSVEITFENLADQWETETVFESIVTRKAMHPAYQRIIGMGPAVVPLILRRLRREPAQWFWALTAITGKDPALGEETVEGATAAWLAWAQMPQS